MGLRPFITFVQPTGKVGQAAQILGQHLTGATSVTFHGVAATSFSVVRDAYLTAVVPAGATTGSVVVTTPPVVRSTNVNFTIIPQPRSQPTSRTTKRSVLTVRIDSRRP